MNLPVKIAGVFAVVALFGGCDKEGVVTGGSQVPANAVVFTANNADTFRNEAVVLYQNLRSILDLIDTVDDCLDLSGNLSIDVNNLVGDGIIDYNCTIGISIGNAVVTGTMDTVSAISTTESTLKLSGSLTLTAQNEIVKFIDLVYSDSTVVNRQAGIDEETFIVNLSMVVSHGEDGFVFNSSLPLKVVLDNLGETLVKQATGEIMLMGAASTRLKFNFFNEVAGSVLLDSGDGMFAFP